MEKERVEKTKTKEEKKLTEEKAAKVRGKKAEKAKKKPGQVTQDQYRYEDLFLYGGHGDLLFGRCFC